MSILNCINLEYSGSFFILFQRSGACKWGWAVCVSQRCIHESVPLIPAQPIQAVLARGQASNGGHRSAAGSIPGPLVLEFIHWRWIHQDGLSFIFIFIILQVFTSYHQLHAAAHVHCFMDWALRTLHRFWWFICVPTRCDCCRCSLREAMRRNSCAPTSSPCSTPCRSKLGCYHVSVTLYTTEGRLLYDKE